LGHSTTKDVYPYYNGDGNRATVVEDGVTTTYSYDGDNQLTSLTS
jgi:YD repeat-containing protein